MEFWSVSDRGRAPLQSRYVSTCESPTVDVSAAAAAAAAADQVKMTSHRDHSSITVGGVRSLYAVFTLYRQLYNHANEPGQAALERSSQDVYDVITLTRAARRLYGQLTMWRV